MTGILILLVSGCTDDTSKMGVIDGPLGSYDTGATTDTEVHDSGDTDTQETGHTDSGDDTAPDTSVDTETLATRLKRSCPRSAIA